jgi:hypothetical protein
MQYLSKYITLVCLGLFLLGTNSCKTSQPGQTYATVEEAEKARAKDKKIASKKAKKEKKKAVKAYWKRQSKSARKRVKKTNRQRKKEAK